MATLLPGYTLDVGIRRKSWHTESYNMNIILRDTARRRTWRSWTERWHETPSHTESGLITQHQPHERWMRAIMWKGFFQHLFHGFELRSSAITCGCCIWASRYLNVHIVLLFLLLTSHLYSASVRNLTTRMCLDQLFVFSWEREREIERALLLPGRTTSPRGLGRRRMWRRGKQKKGETGKQHFREYEESPTEWSRA